MSSITHFQSCSSGCHANSGRRRRVRTSSSWPRPWLCVRLLRPFPSFSSFAPRALESRFPISSLLLHLRRSRSLFGARGPPYSTFRLSRCFSISSSISLFLRMVLSGSSLFLKSSFFDSLKASKRSLLIPFITQIVLSRMKGKSSGLVIFNISKMAVRSSSPYWPPSRNRKDCMCVVHGYPLHCISSGSSSNSTPHIDHRPRARVPQCRGRQHPWNLCLVLDHGRHLWKTFQPVPCWLDRLQLASNPSQGVLPCRNCGTCDLQSFFGFVLGVIFPFLLSPFFPPFPL